MRADRFTALRALESILVVSGIACVGWYGWTAGAARRHQAEARRTLASIVVAPAGATAPAFRLSAESTPVDSRVLGQIDIPSVRLSAAVVDTDDDDALGFAVGYLPDTPPPWRPGNSAFAAHRDGLFRPLKGLRAGDAIGLTTRHGEWQYRVLRTLVVGSGDVWVLDRLPGVDLTLITCFPFNYIGRAPRRFIVQAAKVRPSS
jgi:sortase A